MADLLQRLPDCATRDDCDALAVSFCLVANKPARKRLVSTRRHETASRACCYVRDDTAHACPHLLPDVVDSADSTCLHAHMLLLQVQALCTVPWGQLQVIPYYARIAASLSPVFPEVAPGAAHLYLSLCCA